MHRPMAVWPRRAMEEAHWEGKGERRRSPRGSAAVGRVRRECHDTERDYDVKQHVVDEHDLLPSELGVGAPLVVAAAMPLDPCLEGRAARWPRVTYVRRRCSVRANGCRVDESLALG